MKTTGLGIKIIGLAFLLMSSNNLIGQSASGQSVNQKRVTGAAPQERAARLQQTPGVTLPKLAVNPSKNLQVDDPVRFSVNADAGEDFAVVWSEEVNSTGELLNPQLWFTSTTNESGEFVTSYTIPEGMMEVGTLHFQALTIQGQSEVVSVTAVRKSPNILETEVRKWRPLTLLCEGPFASQTDDSPNPFLDYRLTGIFTAPSGQVHHVPGFFNADGHGGSAGNVWAIRFSPDEVGNWTYEIDFRAGNQIAINLDPKAGTPQSPHGDKSVFTVLDVSPTEDSDFYRWGRLEYVGKRYLKFRDGSYFIKGGMNSSENFLGSGAFKRTSHHGLGLLHCFLGHENDFNEGDPLFYGSGDPKSGDSRGLIGALNYLAERKMNSIYFMPMNIGGDAKDTWPFAGEYPEIDPNGSPSNDNLHYDIGKLNQWNTFFDSAQRKGIFLHFVLNEAEEKNKKELDEGELGVERKLYYREMVARFAHHNALQWNLSEEYDLFFNLGVNRIKEFSQFIRTLDPYGHPVAVHNYITSNLHPLIGDESIQVFSHQSGATNNVSPMVEHFTKSSEESNYPQVYSLDEPKSAPMYLTDYRKIIWSTYLSGGAGFEIFVGSEDQSLEDYRDYEDYIDAVAHAKKFMDQLDHFWNMSADDNLIAPTSLNTQIFIEAGKQMAGYVRDGGNYQIDLSSFPEGTVLNLQWYNPRTGEFTSQTTFTSTGTWQTLTTPDSQDWAFKVFK